MQASPFGHNPPSLGEFIKICKDKHGAEIVMLNREIQGKFGKRKVCALERSVGNTPCHVALPDHDVDVLLSVHIIRHMCNRLQIPTSEFGIEFNADTGEIESIDDNPGNSPPDRKKH